MKKTISIIGSTGSVGLSTLKIIDKKNKFFNVILLSSNKNFPLISKQIQKYKPLVFVVNNKIIFEKIKKKFKNSKTKIVNSFFKLNLKKSDITVSAIPGIAGLHPTILMTKLSSKILIANKESIICGWDLIKKNALRYNTKIIPVDSEHYSIFQLIKNYNLSQIKKIYITASGGPFLKYTKKKLKTITPKDALKHPKWKMGKKVTIDSSTLMNKMLELIEAQKLFNIPNRKLDILIHPNSLVHAIIQLKNGLTKFLYHNTSMIIPLANAMFDGNLLIDDYFKPNKNNSEEIENLIFQKVNNKIFPVINLKNRINEHQSTSIIVNAANEIFVDQFLRKKIPFLAIYKIIMTILKDRNYKKYAIRKPKKISQINYIDNWARIKTLEIIKKLK